jgi:hypothetical protein
MKYTRFQFWVLILIGAALLCRALPIRAQDEPEGTTAEPIYCPSTGQTIPAGTSGDLDALCPPSSGGTRGSPSSSGPSAADIAAERAREAEQQQLEEAQKEQEAEAARLKAAQEEAQREFDAKLAEAKAALKGVSNDDMGLKGVGGSTPFFGLKGVSPDEVAADTKTPASDMSTPDISTAAKQLACAADISNYAFKHVSALVAGTGTQADVYEIDYLAGQAANVMQGQAPAVQCDSGGAPVFAKSPDPKTIAPAYKAVMDDIVKHSETDFQLQQQDTAAQKQVDDTQQRLADLEKQEAAPASAQSAAASPSTSQDNPKPAQSSDEAAAANAAAEQKAWQQADQAKINQVAAQQQKMQDEKTKVDMLALLKREEADKNAIDSREVGETQALTSDVKKSEDILSGSAPQQ